MKGVIEFNDPNFRPIAEFVRRQNRVKEMAELQAQKEWFTDLKDAIERDDKEISLQMVKAAMLLLDRQMNVGQSRKDG